MSHSWTKQEDRVLAEEIQNADTIEEGCSSASDLIARTPSACESRYSRYVKDNMESILSESLSQDDSDDLNHIPFHFTNDYDQFNFLDMNRGIDNKHVGRMIALLRKWGGMLFNLLIIRTSCITGTTQLFVGDGQHRLLACKELGITVPYIIKDCNSEREIARLIADTNNNSKGWGLKDYLHVWDYIGIDDYKVIARKHEVSEVQLSLLIQFYSLEADRTEASKKFKSGRYNIHSLDKSIKLVNTYESALPYFPDVKNAYQKYQKDVAKWILTNHPEKDKFLNIVKNNELNINDVQHQLNILYNS